MALARDPLAWEQATRWHRDDTPTPAPEVVFDPPVNWSTVQVFAAAPVA